jgi:hypothetical protein
LTYGSALVIRNLLMELSVVSRGHEKALREEGPERPIGPFSARASAFRPVLSKGRAHSQEEDTSGVEHELYIGLHRAIVKLFRTARVPRAS